MAHPDNSGSALRFVFKFCTMKGANKYMEIIFKKKSYSGKLGHFGPKMVRPHNFGSPLRYFFLFCTIEGPKRYMKIVLVAFQENISFGAI